MVVLRCPINSCDFATDDVDAVGAAAILTIHGTTHSSTPAAPPAAQPRAPKLVRPTIKLNSTNEEWNAFFRRWETYRTGSNIPDDSASAQLLECTSPELGDIVLRAYPNFTTMTIGEAIPLLKSLAVVPVALGVLRSELNAMQQDPDETFRTFAARVQGKAETCEYRTKNTGTCSAVGCGTRYEGYTYYTDDRIRDTLLQGIADIDIRREALSVRGIQEHPVTDIIAFVETRETARNANPAHVVQGMSAYRRQQRGNNGPVSTPWAPSREDQARTASCPVCQATFNLYTKKHRGWNKKPHEKCITCWRADHSQQQQLSTTGAISGVDQLGQLSVITQSASLEPVSNTGVPILQQPLSGYQSSCHAADTVISEPVPVPQRKKRRKPRRRPQPRSEVGNPIIGHAGDRGSALPGALSPPQLTCVRKHGPRRQKTPEVVALSHQVFSKGTW